MSVKKFAFLFLGSLVIACTTTFFSANSVLSYSDQPTSSDMQIIRQQLDTNAKAIEQISREVNEIKLYMHKR